MNPTVEKLESLLATIQRNRKSTRAPASVSSAVAQAPAAQPKRRVSRTPLEMAVESELQEQPTRQHTAPPPARDADRTPSGSEVTGVRPVTHQPAAEATASDGSQPSAPATLAGSPSEGDGARVVRLSEAPATPQPVTFGALLDRTLSLRLR